MSTYVLAAFLLVFGVTLIISTQIPDWVAGVLAIAAGILLLVDRGWRQSPK
jgi:hypothetical protein